MIDFYSVAVILLIIISAAVLIFVFWSNSAPHGNPVQVKVLFRQGLTCAFELNGYRNVVNNCAYNEGEQMTVQEFGNGWRIIK